MTSFSARERRRRLHEAGRPTDDPRIVEVDAGEFYDVFERAMGPDNPYGAFVSHYSRRELEDMLARYLSSNASAGIAVKDHGDGRIEGTALFSTAKDGMGQVLLNYVVEHDGVNYLECFGEGLVKLYVRNGFTVESVYPFNDEYAPPNWDYTRFNRPDYYTLRREHMEFRKPRTEEERKRFVQEMVDRPAEVRRELSKELKRDNPSITKKELDTELAIVEATLGF